MTASVFITWQCVHTVGETRCKQVRKGAAEFSGKRTGYHLRRICECGGGRVAVPGWSRDVLVLLRPCSLSLNRNLGDT
jgi:hypothetical protein